MSQYILNIDGETFEVTVNSASGCSASVTINGQHYEVSLEPLPDSPAPLPEEAPAALRDVCLSPQDGLTVSAPIPGVVVSLPVKPGQRVLKGQTLAVIEAMKMENDITAPADGTVGAVCIKEGDSLLEGDAIVTLV